jgi:hypothetical protein
MRGVGGDHRSLPLAMRGVGDHRTLPLAMLGAGDHKTFPLAKFFSIYYYGENKY